MDPEQVWYEAFPYLYGTGGLVALFFQTDSLLMKGSGALLVIAALTALRLRRVYRREMFRRVPTAAEVAAAAKSE